MEQRLIDVNKIPYDCDVEYGCDKICNCDNCSHRIVTEKAIKEISPVLTIPENPTNGDMIKALYQGVKLFTNGAEIGFRPKGQAWVIWFHTDWWNAPYKADKEVDNEKR